jgi:hypothetical protein
MSGVARLAAMFAAPLAWMFFLQAEYALVPWACERSRLHHPALYAVAVVALAVAVGGDVLAWRQWRRTGPRGSDEPAPGGRAAFLALTGLGTSMLFTLVILAASLSRLWFTPCD